MFVQRQKKNMCHNKKKAQYNLKLQEIGAKGVFSSHFCFEWHIDFNVINLFTQIFFHKTAGRKLFTAMKCAIH